MGSDRNRSGTGKFALPALLAAGALLSGCGGSSGTAAPPSSTATLTSVSPLIVALTLQQTQLFTANASGSGTLTSSWSVDGVVGGNGTVGTIAATSTANEFLYTP